ncbi:MAG: divalent metal cation transporter [Deltaproteobacteria bacterium]|nr:MAG: divalent metal cation transporter [Deltaproteobacteria bacterium]TMB39867.1 MAG: divalent metal cation transporter [Deltaproteobacteria bacterium]
MADPATPAGGVRAVRSRWARLLAVVAVIGPGIITANVDNDAGGIATYSQAGAAFGYSLLWTLIPITVALIVVQEMCARMGVVTGKGLSDLIRERFGVKATFYVMLALVIANLGNTMAEFAGVAEALEIFGVSRYLSVPLVAFTVWLLVLKGSARVVERIFLAACIFYVAYVIAGFLARPDWGNVALGTFKPTLTVDGPALTMVVTLVGTTIAPWMQFYLQSAIVEKGVQVEDYPLSRLDVIVGCIVTDVVAFFIVLACGATIFKASGRIETAGDAAVALKPLAGRWASALFAFGLFNASLFAASVLPLSTSYYVCEAFGWESGIDRRREDAPQFYFLYETMIVLGAGLVLLPGLPLLRIMLLSQTANGVLLPFILIFMLLLAGDERLMGRYRNGRALTAFAWATAAVLIVLTAMMLWFTLRP